MSKNRPASETAVHVGAWLRRLRETRGLTQDRLAGELHLSSSTISNYETGCREITVSVLVDAVSVLDGDIAELLSEVPLSVRPPLRALPRRLRG